MALFSPCVLFSAVCYKLKKGKFSIQVYSLRFDVLKSCSKVENFAEQMSFTAY